MAYQKLLFRIQEPQFWYKNHRLEFGTRDRSLYSEVVTGLEKIKGIYSSKWEISCFIYKH